MHSATGPSGRITDWIVGQITDWMVGQNYGLCCASFDIGSRTICCSPGRHGELRSLTVLPSYQQFSARCNHSLPSPDSIRNNDVTNMQHSSPCNAIYESVSLISCRPPLIAIITASDSLDLLRRPPTHLNVGVRLESAQQSR